MASRISEQISDLSFGQFSDEDLALGSFDSRPSADNYDAFRASKPLPVPPNRQHSSVSSVSSESIRSSISNENNARSQRQHCPPRMCAPLPSIDSGPDPTGTGRSASYGTADFVPPSPSPTPSLANSLDSGNESSKLTRSMSSFSLSVPETGSTSQSGSSGAWRLPGRPRDSDVRSNKTLSVPSSRQSLDTNMKASDYRKVYEYGCQLLDRGKANDAHKIKFREGIKVLKGLHSRGIAPATYRLALEATAGSLNEPAFPYFLVAAKRAHADSCYFVGLAYAEPHHPSVKLNMDKALHYQLQAASKNHPGASLWLGKHLLRKDPPEAVRWLHASVQYANKSSNEGPFELGLLYEKGLEPVIHQDAERAIHLYTKSAELGYGKACFKVGSIFERGLLGRFVDLNRAFFFYDLGASNGNSECLLRIAEFYLNGTQTVSKDAEKAFEKAELAAKDDLPKAMHMVGLMYIHGVGTKPDAGQGREWIRMAAENHRYQPSIGYLQSPPADAGAEMLAPKSSGSAKSSPKKLSKVHKAMRRNSKGPDSKDGTCTIM